MGEVRIAPVCTRGVELLLVCNGETLDLVEVGREVVAVGLAVAYDDETLYEGCGR